MVEVSLSDFNQTLMEYTPRLYMGTPWAGVDLNNDVPFFSV